MPAEATIYDIAKKLGISAATVSRGLNNHPAISGKTKQRIQEAAKKMGYRSNNFASNLRRQKTNTIGIIIHELNSQFITSVLAGIEKVTAGTGFDLIIGHSSETSEKEIANAHNLFHKRVDGLIASLAYDTKDTQHFEPFIKKGIPVVFFDRVEISSPGAKIIIDNEKAGFAATEHLISQGCKNIVHVTGNLTRNVYADRLKGYKLALAKHKIPFSKQSVFVNDLSESESCKAALAIAQMQPRPDGAFITNDFCAAVCIKTWKGMGLRVPADLAVVGFNNDAISKIVEPSLTTINYPGIEMGEVAARCLLQQLSGTSATKNSIIYIHSELVVRESSLKKPQN
ncbi:MAG TPA: LacI family DNA-binding transcriptional regulator [Chitinophagaceae bacterium]|nr:LacI family DNA-binding transcriptional regulator [Chitinophagaceae bacterium]